MKPKTKRQPGYYWVKHCNEWVISYFNGLVTWDICGKYGGYQEGELDEINPIPITPDDRSLYLEFAEWLGEHYIKCKGGWWHRYSHQTLETIKITEVLFDWWLENVKTKNE